MDATQKPLRISPQLAMYAEKHRVFQTLKVQVIRVFIVGAPASGKITIAKLLCDNTNACLINRKSMLEDQASALATEARNYQASSQEIPHTLWAKLILEWLSKMDCIKRGWVLVGFPVSREQAIVLQEMGVAPDHVVILDAPDTVLIERNLGKRIDPFTEEVYHITFNWPEDPDKQGILREPEGLTEKATVTRLLEYRRESHGVQSSYKKICKVINADQPTVDVLSQVMTFVHSRHRSVAPYAPHILLYGPPGCGKNLQAAMIAEKYKIVDVSSGHLLKQATAAQTKIGEAVQSYVEQGQPVPDSMVLRCLEERLSKLDCITRGWVLHGFPRDIEQATLLEEKGFLMNRVFFMDVPDDAIIERLTLRTTDPVTGERYHSVYKPAPNSEVQARCQQNPKDSLEHVENELKVYHDHVTELGKFYQAVIHINADQDPHTVFEFIESSVLNPPVKRKAS
ncbi:adenylate kinase 8 isoform X2 [Callorhinchus milii]|uniref:adenylate kinase 8 isoform X2 n=1 Tax=Callorhinchus milii TaxID=7868 RepID=UPI0004575457|nr:adenylate kinase 8 isoform X2 [Callorhinchus milii]|eukprot:gi/632969160/ref/XP_007900938.1/ PREDICTED: adenylate kinase 8 isoform X2 [Callorhinchus milii]